MKNFESLKLSRPIQQALTENNYKTPTEIQAKTIPPALEGRDILGCAQTGTGKTAAFALPILDSLARSKSKPKPNRPIVLALAPTRELAIQIADSFRDYGKHIKFRVALVYGGVGQVNQVKAMRRGPQVLVATPGRLLDLMDQGYIELSDVRKFVLDEADRMLDMGFMPAIRRIMQELPTKRQSLFFSATMPPKIREFSNELLNNPVSVNVAPKKNRVAQIKQSVRMLERPKRLGALRELLADEKAERVIVFTRTKHGAEGLAKKLIRDDVAATAIHGDKSQNARQRALKAFRRSEVSVLVATDVAARGIDVDGVTHVVNFDMPSEAESYVHRIGRTGRAGAQGVAVSFCMPEERKKLRVIEQLLGKRIDVDGRGAGESEPTDPASPDQNGRKARRRPKHKGPKSGGAKRNGPKSSGAKRGGAGGKKRDSGNQKPNRKKTQSKQKKRGKASRKPKHPTIAST